MPESIRVWAPVLAGGGLIFIFSTASFSSAHTASILLPLFHWLPPRASHDQLLFLNHLARKLAHLSEYFVFGWLLFGAVRSPQHGWKLRWTLLALLIAAGYSITDEFHQKFVPGRDASPWDSVLDTAGAALAMLAAWMVFHTERTRPPQDNPHPS